VQANDRTAINGRISASLLAKTRKDQILHEGNLRIAALLKRFMETQRKGHAAMGNLGAGLCDGSPLAKELRAPIDRYIRNLIRDELRQEHRYGSAEYRPDLAEK
jgi:hypothetical protein